MSRKLKSKAISSPDLFLDGADMSGRESQITKDISAKTNFQPNTIIWRSTYYNTTKVGTLIILGKFDGNLAVLKIQGARPEVNEEYMTEQFRLQNRSKLIRPPIIYDAAPWNKNVGYGHMIIEYVEGNEILESKVIQTRINIRKFFCVYREFINKCIPSKPWLQKPDKTDWTQVFNKSIKVSEKAIPDHPLRKKGDHALGLDAAKLLNKIYDNIEPEFTHGHFSTHDLKYQGDEIVLFSNLYWKWRIPYFNAIYGYHWFIYELENVKGIKPRDVDAQRKLWQGEIFAATGADKDEEVKRLVNAALLERAIAGLLLDGLMVNEKRPIAKYMTDSTRDEVERLLDLLS